MAKSRQIAPTTNKKRAFDFSDRPLSKKAIPATKAAADIQIPDNVSIKWVKPNCVVVMPVAVKTTPDKTPQLAVFAHLLLGFSVNKSASESVKAKPA